MRKSVIAAAIALAVLFLQGCAPKIQFRTLKQIADSKTLQVLVNPAGEPFAYSSSGRADGSEVDFIREFAESIGVEAVFTISDYTAINQSLNTGAADVAIGKLALANEGYPAGYSLPIAVDRVYIICGRGGIYGGFQALEGKKIGLLGDGELRNLVSRYLPAETEPVQLQSLGVAADYISSGTIDAVLCTRYDARRIMEECGDEMSCEDIAGLEPIRYAAVMARGNDTLLKALNNFIAESSMGEVSGVQDGQN